MTVGRTHNREISRAEKIKKQRNHRTNCGGGGGEEIGEKGRLKRVGEWVKERQREKAKCVKSASQPNKRLGRYKLNIERQETRLLCRLSIEQE